MKKTYFSPAMTVIAIEEPTLLAGSLQVNHVNGLSGINDETLDDEDGLYAD